MLKCDALKLRIITIIKRHKHLTIRQVMKYSKAVNYYRMKNALDFLTHKDINLITIRNSGDNRGSKIIRIEH